MSDTRAWTSRLMQRLTISIITALTLITGASFSAALAADQAVPNNDATEENEPVSRIHYPVLYDALPRDMQSKVTTGRGTVQHTGEGAPVCTWPVSIPSSARFAPHKTITLPSLPYFPKPVLKPGLFRAPEVVDPISRHMREYTEALSNGIYGNWQPVDSCPQEKFRLHFFIDQSGQFQDITLLNPSSDAQANAACIEAVRKTSGFRSKVPMAIHEVEFRLKRSEKH
jgi:hypothetical protein